MRGYCGFSIYFSYYLGGDLETELNLLLYNLAYLTDSALT